ncbi:RluA family pseudouridine synthase [Mesonia sp. MT50]|uniref:RluA family pseudouridine synthase n=1 Tax=Mesonia profundi TaxID=3070998 RepID=A0ABU1A297_9FLAO|nr:RluA family pseudouridine synthase [Mesonia profundi]MDQ7917806.1 RluA family pseudouridine synthase [Mesonia profundi]
MSKIVSTPKNLQVIYEDNHLIVINKRAGDLVQGDKTGDAPLSEVVKIYLKEKHNKPGNVYLGVVHRLDRPTTGIVLFAKTSKALPRLNKIFAERKNQKTYWAMVQKTPTPKNGTLVHYLKRNPKQNKSYAHTNEVPESKKGILHYTTLQELDRYTLLEIDLETGRHHQIRSQLSSIGSSIKGDLKYGFNRSNPDASIHLHARKLKLVHPVQKEEMTFVAALPKDPLWDAVKDKS